MDETTTVGNDLKSGRWTRLRGMVGPWRPATNPLLAADAARCGKQWRRSHWLALPLVALAAQCALSVAVQFAEVAPPSSFGWSASWPSGGGLAEYFHYYIQFSAFHLALYLTPLLFLMPAWWRRRRTGYWEEIAQTPATRGEMLASFLLPRAAMIFVFLYMFYATMWPWNDWWLIVFQGGQDVSPDESWTRWHVGITTLYFTTLLTFNATLAVWASLRSGSAVRATIVYLALSAATDLAGYMVAAGLLNTDLGGRPIFGTGGVVPAMVEGFFTWPDVLYTMLYLHAQAVFAAIFYPVKWILWGLMVRDIARRIPARRWAAADDAKSP